MNALTTWRAEVTAQLTAAGIRTTSFLPEVIRGPGAVLLHGDPYIEPGDTFGEIKANLLVVVFADAVGSNETSTETLDGLLIAAVQALHADYGRLTVAEPAILQNQQQNFLSARLTVSEYFTLERGT